MANATTKQNGKIKSILKAGKIIELLAEQARPVSLTAMAKELGMAKSTLHGIVSTLVDIGFLLQIPESGHYQLGKRIGEIGAVSAAMYSDIH